MVGVIKEHLLGSGVAAEDLLRVVIGARGKIDRRRA